jgi:aspartyl-tRNA(Asn)/glutamyl-tRNA(Gln) amidotransferase subunit B
MEKGQMRCDVNISLRPEGQSELGAKIELKNLNSIAAVRRAIHFETARQTEALDRGEVLLQSTRRWDDDRGETTLMRSKEDAHDYRYFPDPDLLPLHTADILARVTPSLPELPHQKRARFTNDYGCSAYDADVLASEQSLAAYYEAAVAAQPTVAPKKLANWVLTDLLGALNDASLTITD